MSDEIVLPDSPLAARFVTGIQGWVSRDNLFFGNLATSESSARYSGCTHVPCKCCGDPVRKGWLLCDKCRDEKEMSNYKAMPRQEWDGKAMLYSQYDDNYYSSPDEAEDVLDDGESLDKLRLIICEPNFIHIQLDDFDHAMPEDTCPKEILQAIEAFNETVAGVIVSWSPGKSALLIVPTDM